MLIGSLALFILLWIPSLWILPEAVIKEELPDKPLIIGHRGATDLAPENTIASAELAFQLGANGVETDIRISEDGIPFLMHDRTLVRTTNVSEIFPDRKNQDASSFTWTELQMLNAGEWFVNTDPFGSIKRGEISKVDLKLYSGQIIPALENELDVVKKDGLTFIFDLLSPRTGHPFEDTFFDICLSEIQQAGIGNKVWFLLGEDQLEIVRQRIPDMIPTYGADYKNPQDVDFLKENGYQIVNVGYSLSDTWIRSYRAAGLSVNLYVVDEPWMFSDLWLKGVTSMTTNHVEAMASLEKPVGSMSLPVYLIIWTALGLAGCCVLVLVNVLKK